MRLIRGDFAFFTILLSALLTGCGGGGGGGSSGALVPPGPSPTPTTIPAGSYVWTGTGNSGSFSASNPPIAAYPVSDSGASAPAYSITAQTGLPHQGKNIITVDNAHNVIDAWIGLDGAPTYGVTVFAPNVFGNLNPTRTITGANTMLVEPYDVITDSHGTIIVADGTNGVLEFDQNANGNVAPARQIIPTVGYPSSEPGVFAPGPGGAYAVGTDSGGNVYVMAGGKAGSMATNPIQVFAASATGQATPIRQFTDAGLVFGWTTMAVRGDGAVAAIPESAFGTGDQIAIFAATASGDVQPAYTIAGAATGLSQIQELRWDSGGNLWALSGPPAPTTILKFAAGAQGNVSPASVIQPSLHTLSIYVQ